jgi:hypothetical protein
MMIIEDIKRIKSGKSELRKFGITVGCASAIFAALLWWREKSFYIYFLILSPTFILFGIILPLALKPIQKAWMGFSIILGWIVTRIVLFVLFFLVITPISLISRLFGKDFLKIKIDKKSSSYWIVKNKSVGKKEDYERPF